MIRGNFRFMKENHNYVDSILFRILRIILTNQLSSKEQKKLKTKSKKHKKIEKKTKKKEDENQWVLYIDTKKTETSHKEEDDRKMKKKKIKLKTPKKF